MPALDNSQRLILPILKSGSSSGKSGRPAGLELEPAIFHFEPTDGFGRAVLSQLRLCATAPLKNLPLNHRGDECLLRVDCSRSRNREAAVQLSLTQNGSCPNIADLYGRTGERRQSPISLN